MKKAKYIIPLLVVALFAVYYLFGDSAFFSLTSSANFEEQSRKYNHDSTKYILNYIYGEGPGSDGGKTAYSCVLSTNENINEPKDDNELREIKRTSFTSAYWDSVYWKSNDTVVLIERFTEYKSAGKSAFNDSIFLMSGVTYKIVERDPINSSFTRKIIYRETSPDKKSELVVYRYVKPANDYYFLNVSIIKKNDSIPKFGNFMMGKYDYDCVNDIRWNDSSHLDIKASGDCYFYFNENLVKNHPEVKFNLKQDQMGKGNIKDSK